MKLDAVVAAEVVVVVTDHKLATSEEDAKLVADAKVINLPSMTTTSQPSNELYEVFYDYKKVTVKCLRHCSSYYANDQSYFKSHCLVGVEVSHLRAGLIES